MYNPPRFHASDAETAEIARTHPLATLITGAHISHVPLVLEERGGEWVLIGHLARANPHWRALGGGESTAVFHGPQAYVTPTWYETRDVPTWNYVVAHLSGPVRLLEREEDTVAALRVLTARAETPGGWRFEIPEDLAEPGVLMKSIVGFELAVTRREAKLKLSQNRSSSDFDGVLRGLATRKDEGSRGVLAWMQRLAKRE